MSSVCGTYCARRSSPSHFSTHNLFYSGQYGFRVNHSTQLAALELIDRITQDLDQGNMPITIFMDLSKAFDTLNHDILIYKLKAYGLSETALKLMQSYLTNRKQYVEINNTQSRKMTLPSVCHKAPY